MSSLLQAIMPEEGICISSQPSPGRVTWHVRRPEVRLTMRESCRDYAQRWEHCALTCRYCEIFHARGSLSVKYFNEKQC